MEPIKRRTLFGLIPAAILALIPGSAKARHSDELDISIETNKPFPKEIKGNWWENNYDLHHHIKNGKVPNAMLDDMALSAFMGDEQAQWRMETMIGIATYDALSHAVGNNYQVVPYTLATEETKMLAHTIRGDVTELLKPGLYQRAVYMGHQLGAEIASRMLNFDVTHEGVTYDWGSYGNSQELFVRVPYKTQYRNSSE